MKWTTLLLILFAKFSYSQNATIQEIKQTHPTSKKVYIFPIVKHSNSSVEKKINTELRSQILDASADTPEDKIFIEVWGGEGHQARLYDIEHKVIYNEKSLLSLAISAEGCGAYCEPFTSYFNFNLNTGNRLKIDSLLIMEGCSLLVDSLNYYKKKALNLKLGNIQAEIMAMPLPLDSIELDYKNAMMTLYLECEERLIESNYIKYYDFSIKENILTIYIGRCSAHVNRALDEVGNMEFTFNLNHWEKYLTAYGKSLTR